MDDDIYEAVLRPAKIGRPPKGPRLYLRNDEDGTKSWIIRDSGRDLRTGCSEHNVAGAEAALAAYNMGETIQTRHDVNVGRVYFVTCRSSSHYPVKIGWTNGMASRMIQMQGGNPNVLSVLATMRGTPADERELHDLYRHLHIRGEWFRRGSDLCEHIRGLPAYGETFGIKEFADETETGEWL